MNAWLRRGLLAAVFAVSGYGLWRALQPVPLLVETATVTRGDLTVTVDDDGRTRVRERYTISAPIAGCLLRTVLDPGDVVRAGDTVVAEFAPTPPSLLDARSLSEAQAQVRRAAVAVAEAGARAAQAKATATFTAAELARQRDLAAARIGAPAALEQAESADKAAREAQRAAELAAQVAGHELEVAQASLLEAGPDETTEPGARRPQPDEAPPAARRLQLRSPIDGRVLRVFEESTRTLLAGAPILEVGRTDVLEIVADYLTQDAVRVRPGMRVRVEGWGGEQAPGKPQALAGRVRVVEPGGFTKVSALGVEEQRVNVIVDPEGDPAPWQAIGDGYRVELKIVLDEVLGALLVPTGALFRRGDSWTVFVVEGGIARERVLRIGRRSGLHAEALAGVGEGEIVINYPSELLAAGMAVRSR
jgi:HlyD family secretion protein